jgi:tryptophanyl-tRNA synthetase
MPRTAKLSKPSLIRFLPELWPLALIPAAAAAPASATVRPNSRREIVISLFGKVYGRKQLGLKHCRLPPREWIGRLRRMRILSGIQPSGTLHLGNYFGMMRPAVELQEKGEAYYFIANYHSMTSLYEAEARRENTLDVALDFLACGLDPNRSVFFRQSDVPEVTELAWMLTTVTPMGLLERCHSYKDKVAKGLPVNHGLFAYPVLMAADILIYDSNVVPVGRDQKQHVEVTRDIAIKFNETYGQTFVIPEPQIREEVAVVPGLDGQKMSKSYGNTIEIFGDEKAARKKIMSIVTDTRTPAEPKPDADKNIAIQLMKLVAPPNVARDFEERLRAGGLGYGDLKKALFEHYWNYFAGPRAKRAELAANLDCVKGVLRKGAERARAVATQVLKRAKKASGLD